MSLIIRPDEMGHNPNSSWVHQGLFCLAQWPIIRWPLRWVTQTSYSILHLLLIQPLATLYLHGPNMLGFWGGANAEDICAQLIPRTAAAFWTSSDTNAAECISIIERDFWAWLIFLRTVIYFTSICIAFVTLYRRYRRSQPPTNVTLNVVNENRA